MSTEYHHGVAVIETNSAGTAIRVVSTAVIGIVATAPDAEADAFPLNVPVLLTNPAGSIGKAGKGGTLAGALAAISKQSRALTVVVRVEAGEDDATTTTNVIGETTASGQRTGLQALLSAEGALGVKPRIIGAPGLDTQAVANELASICQQLRAFTYVSARGTTDQYAATKEEAVAYRTEFGQREVMVVWPNFLAWDGVAGEAVEVNAVAYALGLRAKLDQQIGWHKSISNMVVNGVEGMTKDVFFDLQSPASDAGYQDDDTGAVKAVEVVVAGRLREYDPGDSKAGDDTEQTHTISLSYYKLSSDGRELIEIDMPGLVFKVDGRDTVADIRRAIGQ